MEPHYPAAPFVTMGCNPTVGLSTILIREFKWSATHIENQQPASRRRSGSDRRSPRQYQENAVANGPKHLTFNLRFPRELDSLITWALNVEWFRDQAGELLEPLQDWWQTGLGFFLSGGRRIIF